MERRQEGIHNAQRAIGCGGEGSVSAQQQFFAHGPLMSIATAVHNLMTPCTTSECVLLWSQRLLNVFWLHATHSSDSVCMPALNTCNCLSIFTCQCVHILHAFIHTNEQWFWAIYRMAILAHHMCQLLLSKWPQTAQATAGKLGGKVGRTNESACSQPQRECVCQLWVCESLGTAGHFSRRTGPQTIHVRKCAQGAGVANNSGEVSHTHTRTHIHTCAHTQHANK